MKRTIIQKETKHYSRVLLSPDETQILSHSELGIGIHSTMDSTNLRLNSSGVYSLDWYPGMNATIPGSSCFIASIKDHPLQLFDSDTGKLRYTYQTKDNADEVCAPLTSKFNLDGSRIYCGFEGSLQIFDTGGELCDVVKLTPNRRSKEGLKGISS